MSSPNDPERQLLLVKSRPETATISRQDDSKDRPGALSPVVDIERGSRIISYASKSGSLGWRLILAITSTWIGTFISSMDSSIMATLVGPISASFESFQMVVWFVNAFLITAAVIQPLSGKLSDIFGRRTGLLFANVVFLIGNLICGVARRHWHFILGRAIAGLGGGALHSIGTILISDFIPLRSRGFWQGMSNIAYGTGFAFGGFIGGFVNDRFGWRWTFLAQTFPILGSAVLIWCLLPESSPTRAPSLRRIDFLGSITLTAGILALLFGTISGGNTMPWTSPLVYISLAIAPILLIAFGIIEDKIAKEPIVPVKLLKSRTVLGSCLNNTFCAMGYDAMIYYVPLFLQVEGLAAAQAGLRLIPTSVGMFLGSIGSGLAMKLTGRYYIFGLGCQLILILSAGLTLVSLHGPSTGVTPFTTTFFSGFGFGGTLTITLVSLISSADHATHASLTSGSYAFRSVGFVLGQSMAGVILQNVFKRQLWERFGSEPDAAFMIEHLRRTLTIIDNAPPSWKDGVALAYDAAFRQVWTFILVLFVLGAAAFAVVRENRLHYTLDRD